MPSGGSGGLWRAALRAQLSVRTGNLQLTCKGPRIEPEDELEYLELQGREGEMEKRREGK